MSLAMVDLAEHSACVASNVNHDLATCIRPAVMLCLLWEDAVPLAQIGGSV